MVDGWGLVWEYGGVYQVSGKEGKMVRMSAGQWVVEVLRSQGVRYVYGVVGSAFLEIMDAMYGLEDIEYVGTRHEQGAGFMALGYAHATGRPGVCLVTNGPGATNLVTPVAGAQVTHAPMVAIIGGISQEHIGRGSFQEVDHVGVFRPVSKASVMTPNAGRIPDTLLHAFRVATSGKMGPVVVDIPRDIQNELEVEADEGMLGSVRQPQASAGDPALLRRAAEVLRDARFPVIVVGGGVKWGRAHEEVVALAEALAAPMVASYGRVDSVPNDERLYVGMLGRAGAPEAAEVVKQADVVLALGTRLSHFTTFYDNRFIPRDAKIVQVEIDEEELGRNHPVEVGILGDVGAASRALLELVGEMGAPPGGEARLGVAARLRRERRERLDGERPRAGQVLKPQEVYHVLRRIYPSDALTVIEAGAASGYAYDRLDFGRPYSLTSPLDLGCIGISYPMALGVKMGCPERPVISINGDGGFLMNAQELETAVRWKIPVVAIVMNNNSWGSEKAYQKFFYGERYIEADITNPRLDKMMDLFGGKGFYASDEGELREAMGEALAFDGPTLIEVPVDPEELPYPARAADVLRDKEPTGG